MAIKKMERKQKQKEKEIRYRLSARERTEGG